MSYLSVDEHDSLKESLGFSQPWKAFFNNHYLCYPIRRVRSYLLDHGGLLVHVCGSIEHWRITKVLSVRSIL